MSSLRFARGPLYLALFFGILGVAALVLPRLVDGIPMAENGDMIAAALGGLTLLTLAISLFVGGRNSDDEDDDDVDASDSNNFVTSYSDNGAQEIAAPMTRAEKKEAKAAEKAQKKADAEQAKFEKNAQKEAAKAAKKAAKNGEPVAEDEDWLGAIKPPVEPTPEPVPVPIPLPVPVAVEEPVIAPSDFNEDVSNFGEVPETPEFVVSTATDAPMYDAAPMEDENAPMENSEDMPDWAGAAYTDPSFVVPFADAEPLTEDAPVEEVVEYAEVVEDAPVEEVVEDAPVEEVVEDAPVEEVVEDAEVVEDTEEAADDDDFSVDEEIVEDEPVASEAEVLVALAALENVSADEDGEVVEDAPAEEAFVEDAPVEEVVEDAPVEEVLVDESVLIVPEGEETPEDKVERIAREMEAMIVSATGEVRNIRAASTQERARHEAEMARLFSALEEARSEVNRLAEDLAANSAERRDTLDSQSILMQAELTSSRTKLEREQAKSRLRQVRIAILSKDPVDNDLLGLVDKTLQDFNDDDNGGAQE